MVQSKHFVNKNTNKNQTEVNIYLKRSQTLNKDTSVAVLKVKSSRQLIQVALK